MIFGNVIAVIVLEEGAEKSTLFTIFSIMAISAALMMLFLRIPKAKTPVKDQKMLNPSFTDSEKHQEAPTQSFLDGKEENPEARSSTELIKETFRLLKNKRMLHMVPFIIWSGCGASFMSGILVPLLVRTMKDPRSRHMHPDLVTDNDRSRQALLTLTALGTGEILGGMFLIGPIRDSFGNRPAYTCQFTITILAIAAVSIYNHNNQYNFSAYIMCFLWGLQDSGTSCLINCLAGFEFSDKMTPFGVKNFVQSLSVFVCAQFCSFVIASKDPSYLLIYLLIIGCFGLSAIFLMLFFPFKPTQ